MFYCFIHNWYSTESQCPACQQTTISSASTQPIEEIKESKEWEWTDELVLEYAVRSHLPNREVTIEEFKASKNNGKSQLEKTHEYLSTLTKTWGEQKTNSIKEDSWSDRMNKRYENFENVANEFISGQPKKRIEVTVLMNAFGENNFIIKPSRPITKEEQDKLKQAIEQALNDEEPIGNSMLRQLNEVLKARVDELTLLLEYDHYTKAELTDREEKAFTGSRERKDVSPDNINLYLKYKDFQDYKSKNK